MKSIITGFFSFLVIVPALTQDIAGQWNGLLKVQGMQLRIVFHIDQMDQSISVKLDSPDQGAKGIPASSATFDPPTLKIEMSALKASYEGILQGDSIIGTFQQSGFFFPLNLSRKAIEKPIVKRPQDPKEPYPYYVEEVTFPNEKANLTLAGTLTLPKEKGPFPVVILISGSGPQDRDETLFNHRPFLVLADHLTRQGIGVLRYDDRGVGQSKGNHGMATSDDFATDVQSAIQYLQIRGDIKESQIGLIGHSEGGLIAPLVAADSEDVAFIVMMAGPGIRGGEIIIEQTLLIEKAAGIMGTRLGRSEKIAKGWFEIINSSNNIEEVRTNLRAYFKQAWANYPELKIEQGGISEEAYVSLYVNQLTSPWMFRFLKYDPAPTLEKVKCPVLAINGEKDLQVPPKTNLDAIEEALRKGGNDQISIKAFPNLNHLFQESETGAPSEYSKIEQTISPVVLEEITSWIKEVID